MLKQAFMTGLQQKHGLTGHLDDKYRALLEAPPWQRSD